MKKGFRAPGGAVSPLSCPVAGIPEPGIPAPGGLRALPALRPQAVAPEPVPVELGGRLFLVALRAGFHRPAAATAAEGRVYLPLGGYTPSLGRSANHRGI